MLCNMIPWQRAHVARCCRAPIQTAWLHRVNGFWERARQPGVIYRHDLIEWNTIHPMWHPESVLRTIFLDVMMSGNEHRTPILSYDRKGWVSTKGTLIGIRQQGVKKKTQKQLNVIIKCNHTTNLFTHFSGCGNIGLLFWLHPSSGNDPLVRMSTTAHKQHLSRTTTVLFWHSRAIISHICIHTHGACRRSEQRQSLDLETTLCARCCRVKKFIFLWITKVWLIEIEFFSSPHVSMVSSSIPTNYWRKVEAWKDVAEVLKQWLCQMCGRWGSSKPNSHCRLQSAPNSLPECGISSVSIGMTCATRAS